MKSGVSHYNYTATSSKNLDR